MSASKIKPNLAFSAPMVIVASAALEDRYFLVRKACWTKVGRTSIAACRVSLAIHKYLRRHLNTFIFVGVFGKFEKVALFSFECRDLLTKRRNIILKQRVFLDQLQEREPGRDKHFGNRPAFFRVGGERLPNQFTGVLERADSQRRASDINHALPQAHNPRQSVAESEAALKARTGRAS